MIFSDESYFRTLWKFSFVDDLAVNYLHGGDSHEDDSNAFHQRTKRRRGRAPYIRVAIKWQGAHPLSRPAGLRAAVDAERLCHRGRRGDRARPSARGRAASRGLALDPEREVGARALGGSGEPALPGARCSGDEWAWPLCAGGRGV